jgi:hypothetical protein
MIGGPQIGAKSLTKIADMPLLFRVVAEISIRALQCGQRDDRERNEQRVRRHHRHGFNERKARPAAG